MHFLVDNAIAFLLILNCWVVIYPEDSKQVQRFLISRHVNDNKIHGSHGVHNQIQSLHHFVQGIIGALSPANHDGELTQGTLGDLMLEAVNDERNALVHHLVQIGRDTCHFRHHANLQNRKKSFFSVKVIRRMVKERCTFDVINLRSGPI